MVVQLSKAWCSAQRTPIPCTSHKIDPGFCQSELAIELGMELSFEPGQKKRP